MITFLMRKLIYILVGLAIISLLSMMAVRWLLRKDLKITNNPLNHCTVNADCFIYTYTNCYCSINVAINRQYSQDRSLLQTTFPSQQNCGACGMGLPPLASYCVHKQCGIFYGSRKSLEASFSEKLLMKDEWKIWLLSL